MLAVCVCLHAFAAATDPDKECGYDVPQWGMSRLVDPVCATEKCKNTPGCMDGCIAPDNFPQGCSWCVYDQALCNDKDLCHNYRLGMSLRNVTSSDCPGSQALPFDTLSGYCLAKGNDVPGLPNGYMTIAQAKKRCIVHRNESGGGNCRGFWTHTKASTRAVAAPAELPSEQALGDFKCGVKLPQYGMWLINDPTCVNASGPNSVGCIGADEPSCSRCVYDLGQCKAIWDTEHSPGMCEQFQAAAQARGAPPCAHKEETYVFFKTEWHPVLEKSGQCESAPNDNQEQQAQYGVIASDDAGDDTDVECFYKQYDVYAGWTLVGPGPGPYKTKSMNFDDAWRQCVTDKCDGFSYGPPSQDPLAQGPVSFNFYKLADPTVPLAPVPSRNDSISSWIKSDMPPMRMGTKDQDVVVI